MNGPDCDTIVSLLPVWTKGDTTPEKALAVEAHLHSCPDCRRALEVIQVLLTASPSPPEGLEDRIQARLRQDLLPAFEPDVQERRTSGLRDAIPFRGRWLGPRWAMSAAALLVLALGTKVITDRMGTETSLDPVAVAAQEPLPESWLWDDGMVAGGLVLDGISDEDLEALIQELEG